MHGWRGAEGCDVRRQRLVRLMWPAARVEAEAPPPPAQGPATSPSGSSVPPSRTTSLPPESAAQQECIDPPRPVSPGSFVKDGREIRVGDCALFRAVDVPPFIGLIRWIEKKEDGHPKLRVSWLYRPTDVKLNKGIQLSAAPNEIFYSFHQDEASAVSLLHPCKVAFLRKGVELPAGISSFVCWRVYDIDNKCLWWLTDKDYINEEVNRLLHRTRLEMRAALQSGGRSPKRLNGPSASQQLKTASVGTQNGGLSKGKKRDRSEQGVDPAKRDRDRLLKVDDSEPGIFNLDDIKSEIAKITEKDGLPNAEAVEKLVHLMQLDRTEQKIDLSGRVILADVIAATENPDCLGRFVQSRGLPVLDSWLQEAHKGKSGDGSSPKEADKPIDELLLALLRALAKLPINLSALQSCSIGKSVNHLRSHKNLEIQKKAKCLVENWKKRVDAEMKSNDVKPLVSGQSVSWSGKAGFQEISNAGTKRGGSSENSPKNPVPTLSSSKFLTDKPGGTDAEAKLNPGVSALSNSQHVQPTNVTTNLKDQPCKSTGGTGPELPTVKEEKTSSSSQSPNNSQSISSEPSKDARSSTAASGGASKTSESSSRSHRKANNGLVSGNLKEASVGRSVSLDRSLLQDKSSQTGTASEKGPDMPLDHGNNHRLIVRFPNPGRSPARSASAGSFDDPSVTGGRASSPMVVDRHDQTERKVKGKTENTRPHLASDANTESWHSNDGATGSEEGDKSPCAILDDDNSRTPDDSVKDTHASRVACSSHTNEKGVGETKVGTPFSPMNALIEIKYSEASHSQQAGDDTAMNLLASVAGEISKSELVSPASSPRSSSVKKLARDSDNIGKVKVESDTGPSHPGQADAKKGAMGKEVKIDACLVAKEEQRQTMPSPELPDSKAVVSSAKIEIYEVEAKIANKCNSQHASIDSKGESQDACTAHGKVVDGSIDKDGAMESALGSQCRLVVPSRNSRLVHAGESSLSAADKQAQGLLKSTNHKQLLSVSDNPGAFDRRDSMAGKMDLLAAEVRKTDAVGNSNIVQNEAEKKEHACSSLPDVPKLVVAAASPVGVANVNKEMKESKDSSSESNSHVKSEGVNSQQSEQSAMQSSKKSCDGVSGKEDEKEDHVLSDEGSSLAAHTKSNATAKLDFDLNEGIPGDDGHQSEPTISPVVCSSAINLTGILPFTSPITTGLQPASITVAAPAKGPFVPPENLLRAKPEIGWKGSAATSAFRPAEPRKILEIPAAARDIPVSHAAGKQSRPTLGFDLNVADDQALEEDIPQSSAQTTCSESGNTRSRDGSSRSAGIELDLNRADEVADNGQFAPSASHRVEVPLLSTRSLHGVFSNAGMNSARDFDLNSGPGLDDLGTEPAPKSLPSKSTSSIQFLPQVPVRMNSAAMSNISPWLASASPCPVAIQSFLSTREQPYPIEAAPGAQRIIAPTADAGQFGGDPCRPPVVSTSPAMVFHQPAYQYPGFPFPPSVHLQTPAFSIGSATFNNSASAGVPYFPTVSPSFVGPAGALTPQHLRQYAINLAEGSSSSGRDSNRKWESQGLDLNSGPGSIDLEGKDERVPLPVRQNLIPPPHGFVEDQGRIYQMPVVGTKRKEPDGSWDSERSTYKQLSWQ
ncbi:BAH domain [Zea mays]|uniref:BAH domain n=1 Tax=Zea mays TaxID=4577 RepID=A0A1D6P6F5_MAIZE|nr:BAH domain [Zea mays]